MLSRAQHGRVARALRYDCMRYIEGSGSLLQFELGGEIVPLEYLQQECFGVVGHLVWSEDLVDARGRAGQRVEGGNIDVVWVAKSAFTKETFGHVAHIAIVLCRKMVDDLLAVCLIAHVWPWIWQRPFSKNLLPVGPLRDVQEVGHILAVVFHAELSCFESGIKLGLRMDDHERYFVLDLDLSRRVDSGRDTRHHGELIERRYNG